MENAEIWLRVYRFRELGYRGLVREKVGNPVIVIAVVIPKSGVHQGEVRHLRQTWVGTGGEEKRYRVLGS